MDLAYDHIQEVSAKEPSDADKTPKAEQHSSLNDDIQEAYKYISSSTWGAKLGGFLETVVKQGESVYEQAQKELAEVGEDATKGFSELRESIINRTRSMSLTNIIQTEQPKDGDDDQSTPTQSEAPRSQDNGQETETMLSRLRAEAAKRLKDLQKAEDAADEALARFGGNIRDFLRDAIRIAPPVDAEQWSTVPFESTDAQGKRVIHTSRFEAELHVIHTSPESFTKEPSADQLEKWADSFNLEKKTEEISEDLSKYPELRTKMEKLVPDQVSYADFWKRYYFLRNSIETAESKRRDLLKAASTEDEIGWGNDSDEAQPDPETSTQKAASVASFATLPSQARSATNASEARKSNDEKSQADSEASYDVVGATSGKTSQAPGTPKEVRKDDDSDDDWE